MIDYKLEFVSLLLGTITFSGILKMYVYYKRFDISILPYLEISDIITVVFDNILASISVLIATIIFLKLFHNLIFDMEFLQSLDYCNFVERFLIYKIFSLGKVLCLTVLVTSLYFLNRKRAKINNYEYFLWGILLLNILFMLPYFLFELVFLFPFLRDYKNLLMFYILFVLIIVPLVSAVNESYKVKKGYYVGCEFETKLNTIISTSKKSYIGRTKNHVFFSEFKKQKTDIYQASEFIKITMVGRR